MIEGFLNWVFCLAAVGAVVSFLVFGAGLATWVFIKIKRLLID